MARPLICDICKKETDAIAGKLFYAPNRNDGGKSFHNNYQFHLDVGVCCEQRLLHPSNFRWTKRISAKAYHTLRRRKLASE